MDRKRGWISFVLIFAFVILSLSLISSTSCTVTTSCAPANIVMKLSSLNNAHGEWYAGTNYNSYFLCCTGLTYVPTHNCVAGNTVLRLSSPTNAHAEVPGGTLYNNLSCFGIFSCTSVVAASCPINYPLAMLSLSASTNAHLGNFSTYGTKICCVDLGDPICGNNDVEAGEACDDGNLNNGDGCSSGCNIEAGYNCIGDPSCCYRTSPTYSWLKNGVAFNSGGEIRSGDILTMRFNEDFCKPSGAGTLFEIREGSTTRASSPSTIVSGLPGTTTSIYTAPLAFLQALGPGVSSILFRTTVDGTTYNSNTISVTPIYCGNGNCNVADGETCTTCPGDCGSCCGNGALNTGEACDDGNTNANDGCSATCTVEPGYTCVGGPSVCTLCAINSATWRPSLGLESGDRVNLEILTNSACNGKTFTFEVWRNVLIDNLITTVSSNVIPVSGNGTQSWTIAISNDGNYYFRAILNERTTIRRDSSDVAITMPVIPQCGINGCQAAIGENCATCPADCGCSAPNQCINSACKVPCDLTSATWSTSSTYTGTVVSLNVQGSNCNGQLINYEIWEDDFLIGDDYMGNPATSTMVSGTTSTTWVAVAPDPDGETSPDYYFIARVIEGTFSDSIKSATMEVLIPRCGDGIINVAGETCDDGNTNNRDGCSSICRIEVCGDGTINQLPGIEQCDDGGTVSGDGCSNICKTEYCGDGVTQAGIGETCDDGNTISGDGCSNICRVEILPSCGDCSLDSPGEECDDCGNVNNDGCSAGCMIEHCGDGIIQTIEQCDDGNILPNDGCSAICANEICGDGIINQLPGVEECDDSNLVAGDGCSAICKWEFTCGDGTLEPPMEECDDGGTVPGDGCSATCTLEGCALNSASWSASVALSGSSVDLNVQGTNCNGKEITFELFEEDFSNADDVITPIPAPIPSYSALNNHGTWTTVWHDDDGFFQDGNPPEYYFIARVTGVPGTQAQSGLLQLIDSAVCVGVDYCYQYTDETECNSDVCDAGLNSVPTDIQPLCGVTFNAITGCTDTRDCGCSWDAVSGVCEASWDLDSDCPNLPDCVDDFSVNDCWLQGDACQADCSCENGYTPTTFGDCQPIHVCDPLIDICWLQGDLCTDDCICETGYTPNLDGTCGPSNPDVCDPATDDCWLMGDKCEYDCTCEIGYSPNGLGYCEPTHVCDSGDECWIIGEGCQIDCECENDDPTGLGGCSSGGSGGLISRGTCVYTQDSSDTCEDDQLLDRILIAVWNWNNLNSFLVMPTWGDPTDFFFDGLVYRYDPQNERLSCAGINDQVPCPALVQLPFFGFYQVVIALAIVGLIYLLYFLKKKNNSKTKNSKKPKTKGKKRK